MSPLIMAEVKHGNTLDFSIIDIFKAHEYKAYRLVPAFDCLVPFTQGEQVDTYLLNLFFVKKDLEETLAQRGLLIKTLPPNVTTDGLTKWENILGNFSYGKSFMEEWVQKTKTKVLPEWKTYERLLNCYLMSRDTQHSLESRFAYLSAAAAGIGQLLDSFSNVARLLTAARICLDFGFRSPAANIIKAIRNAIADGVKIDLSEPFVLQSPDAELNHQIDNFISWLNASLYIDFTLLDGFTGMVSKPVKDAASDYYHNTKYQSQKLERKFFVYDQLQSNAATARPPMLLTKHTQDNINDEFWSSLIKGDISILCGNKSVAFLQQATR